MNDEKPCAGVCAICDEPLVPGAFNHECKQSGEFNHDEYGERLTAMRNRISERLGGRQPRVFFSAYKTDDDGMPIDNLNTVPVTGEFVIVHGGDNFFGSGRSYRSKKLESPTWLELCVVADEMIRVTEDRHHQFLEAIVRVKGRDGEYRFLMGS